MNKIPISEIKFGDNVEIKKVMTEKMVKSFANISEDYNPVHLDKKYASKSRYKKPIIHGLMGASLFSGLFGTKLPGEGCVYKSQNIRFKRPIYIGEVLTARIEVIDIDIKNKILKFSTIGFVNNKIVIDGYAEIFIP